MRRELAALVSGTLFGLGLAVSQMINPAKVLGFLDLAGAWDPSLAFVMGGALLVTLPAFRIILRQPAPRLGSSFQIPTASVIDTRLIGGATIFGIGWGLVGFCPGPALAALASGDFRVALFVIAMLAGMALHSGLHSARPKAASAA